MEVKKIGVVGCGIMGQGITEVSARSGFQIVVSEISQELLEKGLGNIKRGIQRAVQGGKLTQPDADAIVGRIKGTVIMTDFQDCDLVIEAVAENMEMKKKVFTTLDGVCKQSAILASNTSVLSITDIGMVTRRPDKVIGLHFFNPATVMKLVEIIRTLSASDETINTAIAFTKSIGKTGVVTKDGPGFIVNRLVIAFVLDAIRMLELGIGTKEDIDQAVVLGLNHPMGPLTLVDAVGLDTALASANAMYGELKDPRFVPPMLLRKMVASGRLGRKAGKGFYDYTAAR